MNPYDYATSPDGPGLGYLQGLDVFILESALGGLVIGMVAVVIGLVCRRGVDPNLRYASLILGAGVAAYATQVSPLWRLAGPASIQLWHTAFVVEVGLAGSLWLMMSVFFADKTVSLLRLAPVALLMALGAGVAPSAEPVQYALIGLICAVSVVLSGHAFWLIWSGRTGDLVEARRKVRRPLVIVAGLLVAYTVAQTAFELAVMSDQPGWINLWRLVFMAIFALAMVIATGQLNAGLGAGPTRPLNPGRDIAAKADAELLKDFQARMAGEELWRREGLTIGALAAEFRVSEARLRRVIHEGLGFRNFQALINSYRVEAAKSRLSDPKAADAGIADLAFDLGYFSLGPFNRAFREATGQTPSEWRRANSAA